MKFPKACFLLNKGNEWLPTQLQHGDLIFRDHMYRFGIRRDGRVIHANVDENPANTYAPAPIKEFESFQTLCTLIGYATGLRPYPLNRGSHLYECTFEGAPEECQGILQATDKIELDECDHKLRVLRDNHVLRGPDQTLISFPTSIPGRQIGPLYKLIGNAARLAVANVVSGSIYRCSLVTPNDLVDAA